MCFFFFLQFFSTTNLRESIFLNPWREELIRDNYRSDSSGDNNNNNNNDNDNDDEILSDSKRYS